MHDHDRHAQDLSRRLKQSAREIALALALSIAAGAFLFATLIDDSRHSSSRPVLAVSSDPGKKM